MKRIMLKKTIYNSGKFELANIHSAESELLDYSTKKISLSKVLSFDIFKREQIVSKDDLWDLASYLDGPITSYSHKSIREGEIAKELRKLNLELKRVFSKNLLLQIKSLVSELKDIFYLKLNKKRCALRILRKSLSGSLKIDFRKRFRNLVINLSKCYNDCSKNDADDNYVVLTNFKKLLLIHLFDHNVQQERNYQLYREVN